jgi:hypothetical protein
MTAQPNPAIAQLQALRQEVSALRQDLANPKWDYLVLQVVIVRMFGKSSIDIGCDDPEVLKAIKGKSTTDALSYIGSLGWEMVVATPGSAVASNFLYFKRRAQ